MYAQFFSLKIEEGVLHLQDANFLVSAPIDRVLVISNVIKKLRRLNLSTDTKALNYVIRESHLFAEGWAYGDRPLPPGEFIILNRS